MPLRTKRTTSGWLPILMPKKDALIFGGGVMKGDDQVMRYCSPAPVIQRKDSTESWHVSIHAAVPTVAAENLRFSDLESAYVLVQSRSEHV